MIKKVVISGMLGWVFLIVWGFTINGIFGFNSRVNMKQIPGERVYETIKESILEPGRYILNPELNSSGNFPGGQPVFSILYSGLSHEAAGRLMVLQLGILLLTPMIAAWMLSFASRRVLSSYPRKVLFFIAIGLLFAVFGDFLNFGIDGYPLNDTFLLAIHDISLWTLLGLVVAWRISPDPGSMPDSKTM